MTHATDDYFDRLARVDWVLTGSDECLHASTGHHYGAEFDAIGVTVCGIQGLLQIPVVSERMENRRCQKCCADTGIPEGIGSPKNDEACRSALWSDSSSASQ